MQDIDIYSGTRDIFYCLSISSKSINRDNKLSELFDDQISNEYYAEDNINYRNKIYCARFWKDKDSILLFTNRNKNYNLISLSREEFIDSIPDISEVDEVVSRDKQYIKNLNTKKTEIEYLKVWEEYRKKYKATNIYKKVSDPQNWLPCKYCRLIPLIWEFDNGRFTACGCGKNEYENHSIQAESIMSFFNRYGNASGFNNEELKMNWNQWVKVGQDVFECQKKINNKIW